MTIDVHQQADWHKLEAEGLHAVVDPMILRCGEIFLKGARQINKPKEMWALLSANIYAIGMFFDSLILNEHIPVFNYGSTYDMHLRFDERTLTLINLLTDTQVLVDVSVQYQPYQFVKEAALEELKKKVDALQRNINLVSARSILTELAAAEYRWSPSLEALEPMLATPEDKQLAAFLLGGLIFTGFAQQMDGEHLLQPKRSRLFLEASFDVMTDRQELEQGLFAELKERAQTALVDVPWLPTFFPYLLTRCNTPMEMLQEVVHLRQSGEVKDYRVLLRNIMDMQQQNGRIPVEMEKEIAKIVKLIDTQLGKIPSMPKVDASVSIVNVATGTLPGRVDPTPWLERQWGWFLASLPAHRHRKLLTRVVIAEREYKNLDRRVKKVWQAG